MNKFYVYSHLDADGTILYIGKGKNGRAWDTQSRCEVHREWMQSRIPHLAVNVIASNLDEETAIELEKAMLRVLHPRWNTQHTYHNSKKGGKRNKLKPQDVKRIRFLLDTTDLTQGQIGDIFGVSHDTVSLIKLNKIWTHTK